MDSMLPQPPANLRPAPPPDREVEHVRAKQNMIWLLGGVSIVFCCVWLSGPRLFRQRHLAYDRTEALNNIRQVGMALAEFDSDYGKFPDAITADEVATNTGTSWSSA
jgi:hypothetical protein